MDVLPDDSRDGAPGREPHDDDLLAAHAGSSCFTTTAGFPATTTFAGTLLVTMAPAATTELSPISTPFQMIAPMPIHTLLPIRTGAVFSFGRAGRPS